MSDFTYKNFVEFVKKDGLVKPNRFEVQITPPPALIGLGHDPRTVTLMTKTVNVPGVNVSTSNVVVVGEPITVAYSRTFGEATFTFYMDKKFVVRRMFEEWVDAIQDPSSRLLGWYNDTVTEINVTIFDKQDNPIFDIALFEAKPRSIGAVQLDQGASDIMIFDVTFDYKYYRPYFRKTQSLVEPPMEEVLLDNSQIEY